MGSLASGKKRTMLPQLFEENVSLKSYCSYGIGGLAKYFAKVKTIEEMQQVLIFAIKNQIPYVVIGKGSNLLISDKGYQGLVVLNRLQTLQIDGNIVTSGSGYSFPLLATKTAALGLSGLEFAIGVPGTVGGAIFMNAGASGVETKDTLESVVYLDSEGKKKTLTIEQLEMGYRTSIFQKIHGVIVSARFSLAPSLTAKEEVDRLITYRKKTQPYYAKTCGCCFRNPENKSAGKLIEEAGLKGFQVGGVKVSEIHANFLENVGEGTATDVRDLMAYIQMKVYARTKYSLEPEVRFIGE